jgi:hypothetical protein
VPAPNEGLVFLKIFLGIKLNKTPGKTKYSDGFLRLMAISL